MMRVRAERPLTIFCCVLFTLFSSAASAELLTRIRIGQGGATYERPEEKRGQRVFPDEYYTFPTDETRTTDWLAIGPTPWAFDPDYSGLGSGAASAAYGSLGVFADVHRTTSSPDYWYYFTVVTNSQFSDFLTIDSPGLTGTPGSVVFFIDVTGELTGNSNAYITARLTNEATGVRALNQQYSKLNDKDLVSVDVSLSTSPVEFIYGTPLHISMLLLAQAATAGGPDGSPGTATSDFLNTMKLTGFDLYSADGGRVTNYTAVSVSGTDYQGGRAVPEPATVLLLGCGLLGMFGARHRKHTLR